MDKDERKVLGGKVSVRHSAALMRAAMNLHYANVFTHAVAVWTGRRRRWRTGRGRGRGRGRRRGGRGGPGGIWDMGGHKAVWETSGGRAVRPCGHL